MEGTGISVATLGLSEAERESIERFERDVIQPSMTALVILDFWAEWCGPCRRLAPTVDELATDYDGRLVVAKMNVDENPSTPNRFSVRGIPTLLLFKGGQVVEQVVGLTDKDSLKKVIDKHVAA